MLRAPKLLWEDVKSLGQGYFVEPTVLVNTRENMKVVQEEIFGPVVAAFRSKRWMRSCPGPMTRFMGWPQESGRETLVRHTAWRPSCATGTVWINCYNIFDAALPFGGYKQSGWGREMGRDVLEMYTEVKAICSRIG